MQFIVYLRKFKTKNMKNTTFLKFEGGGGGGAVMSTFAESTKIFDGTQNFHIFPRKLCYPFPNNSIFQLKNPILADLIRKSKKTQWILKSADLLLSRRGVLTPYTPSSAVPDHILQKRK